MIYIYIIINIHTYIYMCVCVSLSKSIYDTKFDCYIEAKLYTCLEWVFMKVPNMEQPDMFFADSSSAHVSPFVEQKKVERQITKVPIASWLKTCFDGSCSTCC